MDLNFKSIIILLAILLGHIQPTVGFGIEEMTRLKELHNTGIQARDAIRYMRQHTNTHYLPRNIYNAYAQFKRERVCGLAVTDALIEYLKAKDIPHTIKPDINNRTRYLFIAHPESLKLAHAYPDVAIADCTYQTNKFNMPLLHLIGITSFAKTFSIGFAFLPNESTEAYEWALLEFQKVGINPPVMAMDGSDGLAAAA